MDMIEQLEYKYKIDKAYKATKSFDKVFQDQYLLFNIGLFISSTIGQIWLNKPNGLEYTKWQQT